MRFHNAPGRRAFVRPGPNSAVLVAIGDTHGTDGHRLEGAALAAVREADAVVHTGDFTTVSVLDAVADEATDLAAVAGNNDDAGVRARLPATRTVEALDRRFVVAHGHEHDATSLSLLAREAEAAVAIVGHSHRPDIRTVGDVVVLNPGSYADPRWNRPGFATVTREDGTVTATLRTPAGERFESATV